MENLTTDVINNILGIKESYQASDTLMKILFDKEKREKVFREFLEYEKNLDFDWFHIYFEEEHANKLKFAQDFTPDSISKIVSRIVAETARENNSMTLDTAAGTGSLTIQKWNDDRLKVSPFDYRPSNYFYRCEELSDRALPFLVFNLMVRGMNAIVIHGDALNREAKQVYFIQNDEDDHMMFSNLNVMPHSLDVEKEFDIRHWLEEAIDHKESSLFIERGE
ncbi:MAG TPA: N-6 DNA methylase [Candidatus Enterococcus avicola]|uniref:N-6 DNA methylase n=1 Tax=Candidatus Enterococcus avicola TaxID=2838561 RepID=A0A9D2F7H1_9ENTE|nr:N-6 DNA methylase [Candidatus Enterococcus avicola]